MKFIRGIALFLGIIFLCSNSVYSGTLTDYIEGETTVKINEQILHIELVAGNYSDSSEVYIILNDYPIKLENTLWLKLATKEKSRFRIVGSWADTNRWDIISGISVRIGGIREADFGLAFMADFPDFEHYSIEAQIWRELPILFQNTAMTFGCGYRWKVYPGICFSMGMSIGL